MRANDAPLPPALRDRLTKLLGMTQSSHDGEALNAVRLANRVLAEHRLTWREALGTTTAIAARPDDEDFLDDWRSVARLCAEQGRGILTDWEMDFVRSLPRFRRISSKQEAILLRCAEKVGAA